MLIYMGVAAIKSEGTCPFTFHNYSFGTPPHLT